jgi:hypothetical protein
MKDRRDDNQEEATNLVVLLFGRSEPRIEREASGN